MQATTPYPPPELESTTTLRWMLHTNRERALTQLYQQAFPTVRRYVRGHGGSAQDAQDVFQDALLIFYEKILAGPLTLTAAPGTYLVGIGQNLWRRELARRQHHPHVAVPDELMELADSCEQDELTVLSVLDYVEQLGEKCRSILLAFYYCQQPLSQIAAQHQYRSVRSATVQKFKCLERLRSTLRSVLHLTFEN